ncbi:MAG: bifunctional oligoribonuclease/PAP phosphatase NrnA [Armatimonadetes bacterium]|nr:bifunctional oligoribonuclease/PAP phosphatase NrnA [Armatimonadota bacterium]
MSQSPESSPAESLQPTGARVIADRLAGCRRVLVATHENPDGDGIGSMLALRLALSRLGCDAVCVLPQGCPRRYRFLPATETILAEPPPQAFDCAIALDCDAPGRLGDLEQAFFASPLTLNVDHHAAENEFAQVNWCDGTKAATGLMVLELIRAMGVDIDAAIATCLYCAIVADTGVFRFQNTSSEALRAAADLLEAGANPAEIARRAAEEMPLAKARLLGRALASARLEAGVVLIATLSLDDFQAAEALPEHTDGIIDDLKRISEARVTMLLREERPGSWRVSLRSQDADVATVCRKFGGGGHRLAAGCELEASPEEVTASVLREILAELFP